MDIRTMQRMVHQLAKKKGWWEPGNSKSDVESIMLMVTELSEAVEEIRNGKPPIYFVTPSPLIMPQFPNSPQGPIVHVTQPVVHPKPEGTLIELADTVIRILDLCGKNGWDLEKAILLKHQYNKTRAYRHGGKRL